MEKEKAVKQIRDHVMEIKRIAREFGTDDYLTIAIWPNSITFCNEHWPDGKHGRDGLDIQYFENQPTKGDL